MISRIEMKGVACYKHSAVLATDKRINLVYGLNGTGKSKLSDFMYDSDDEDFAACSVDREGDAEVMVYNQRFIHDYFRERDDLPGVFTLSKENASAEALIKKAEESSADLELSIRELLKTKSELCARLDDKKRRAMERVWEIKSNYSGGDRELDYCLKEMKGSKESLFDYLSSLGKPSAKPGDSVEDLIEEVASIRKFSGSRLPQLPSVEISVGHVESNVLFGTPITGSEDTPLSAAIERFQNADWVKQGLQYLPERIGVAPEVCPFCQHRTITEELLTDLRSYFDESYDAQIEELKRFQSEYELAVVVAVELKLPETSQFTTQDHRAFEKLSTAVRDGLNANLAAITGKIANPSTNVSLRSTTSAIDDLNHFIESMNDKTDAYNAKLSDGNAPDRLKARFWELMRWEYDQTLSEYQVEQTTLTEQMEKIDPEIAGLQEKIERESEAIRRARQTTVNIDEAVANINTGLRELGIDEFWIEKLSDERYRLARPSHCEDPFRTLSEGEKMIVSFLYFRELVRGRRDAASRPRSKIAFIDDPISSLSHIYIFNVGQMIKNDFFGSSSCEQVFILTHSLYFFHELARGRDEVSDEYPKLFRLVKSTTGSRFDSMERRDIQNDYESYWSIIRDRTQPNALVANCMRHIVEYFFGFVGKHDLNSLFQKPELQQVRFQAFHRFINRESHSDRQNIYDLKEFDYENFRKGLEVLFEVNGYGDHYKKMMT